MAKACAIKFQTNKALINAMHLLYKKGFVFTTSRHKGHPRQYYSDWYSWKYIYVGHKHSTLRPGETPCKAVINTSEHLTYSNNEEMSFHHFWTKVLPTW